MTNRNLRLTLCGVVCMTFLGAFSACEKQGPLERAGEELDEAGRAIKNGGEQTTADKVDDSLDRARENAKDAREELKQEAKK